MTQAVFAERIVRCPRCGGDSLYAASNPSRPFCSARCKNNDFGAWASETYRVAKANAVEGGEEGSDELPELPEPRD